MTIERYWAEWRKTYTGGHHGELRQDLFVLFITGSKTKGLFVEFGAMDGLRASNTLLLEREYGWSGVMSEPNPRYNVNLPKNRACRIDLRCVSDRTGDRVQFQTANESGWPGMVGHIYREANSRGNVIDVETVSLNDLIDQNGLPAHVDYISVDTDGSEPMIMRAFDFAKNSATIWTIEHNEEPWREDIRHLMEANGYRRVLEESSGYDDWYVQAKVLERFST
jgi:FkbM family methyltransferase